MFFYYYYYFYFRNFVKFKKYFVCVRVFICSINYTELYYVILFIQRFYILFKPMELELRVNVSHITEDVPLVFMMNYLLFLNLIKRQLMKEAMQKIPIYFNI